MSNWIRKKRTGSDIGGRIERMLSAFPRTEGLAPLIARDIWATIAAVFAGTPADLAAQPDLKHRHLGI